MDHCDLEIQNVWEIIQKEDVTLYTHRNKKRFQKDWIEDERLQLLDTVRHSN